MVVVFVEDDDDELIRMAAEKGFLLSSLKNMQGSIISVSCFRIGKHVLDTDSRNHSDATMKDL